MPLIQVDKLNIDLREALLEAGEAPAVPAKRLILYNPTL